MIRGAFAEDTATPEPFVGVQLRLPGRSPAEPVFLLIDTGATNTTLHPTDASDLQIRFDETGRPQITGDPDRRLGVGGTSRNIVVPTELTLEHTDGRTQTLEIDLRIAYLTDTNRYLPSILGWEVLQFFDAHLDWRTRTIELS